MSLLTFPLIPQCEHQLLVHSLSILLVQKCATWDTLTIFTPSSRNSISLDSFCTLHTTCRSLKTCSQNRNHVTSSSFPSVGYFDPHFSIFLFFFLLLLKMTSQPDQCKCLRLFSFCVGFCVSCLAYCLWFVVACQNLSFPFYLMIEKIGKVTLEFVKTSC